MSRIAFALREEFTGTVVQYEDADDTTGTEVPAFTGGVINIGDGSEEHTLDLAEALNEGDGVIVLAEDVGANVVDILTNHPALKRVTVDDEAETDLDRYDALGYDELKDEAKRRDLPATGNTDALRDRLREADAAADAGADNDTTDEG